MKKLVSLGVVLLFVLMGMTGIASAQTSDEIDVLIKIKGTVTIDDFGYPCNSATVNLSQSSAPELLAAFPGSVTTRPDGTYWMENVVSYDGVFGNLTPRLRGYVQADWNLNIWKLNIPFSNHLFTPGERFHTDRYTTVSPTGQRDTIIVDPKVIAYFPGPVPLP
jgi:hypothetical protein